MSTFEVITNIDFLTQERLSNGPFDCNRILLHSIFSDGIVIFFIDGMDRQISGNDTVCVMMIIASFHLIEYERNSTGQQNDGQFVHRVDVSSYFQSLTSRQRPYQKQSVRTKTYGTRGDTTSHTVPHSMYVLYLPVFPKTNIE